MADQVYNGWGGSNINRISLDIISGSAVEASFKFAVNPQEYTESHTVRTYLQQTRTANTVQRFGEGVATITISGHFGDRQSGYTNAMSLRSQLMTYLAKFSDNNLTDSVMAFKNYTMGDFWYVEPAPNGYSFSISANSPTIINYQITFYIVSDMSQANPTDRTDTTLGNDKVAGTTNYTNPNVLSTSAKTVGTSNVEAQLDK